MKNSFLFSINEMSAVGEARRAVVELSERIGFGETDSERAAIVVTEAATNQVKHAGGGQILLRQLADRGLEILALDKGAGIHNPGEALRDGFSTTSSPGNGLGAISRLSTLFQFHSQAGIGTALLAQILPKNQFAHFSATEFGVVCVPHPRETVCGDGWAVRTEGNRLQILVADGLGHGKEAAWSADEAIRLFHEQPNFRSPVETLGIIHQGLRHTRGMAAAIAEIERGTRLHFSGVGNIAGVIYTSAAQKHLVSHAGIVGHEARKITNFEYSWETGALLILSSDGIQTRCNLEQYAGLLEKHPSLIAGVLYRDFTRGNDDATILVLREK